MFHQNLISFCDRKIDFTDRKRVMKCILVLVKLVPISHNILINEGRKWGLNLIIETHDIGTF